MEKGIIVLLIIGIGFLYFVTNFVGDIQEQDERFQNKQSQKQKELSKYYKVDSVGDTVLDFTGASLAEAKKVWSTSFVKDEILAQLPNFETVKQSIENRVEDGEFRQLLLQKLGDVEGEYLSGSTNAEKAKEKLTNL